MITAPDTLTANEQRVSIPVEAISPSPFQPRKKFNEASLAEMAASIHEHGVLQAIMVRPLGSERYQLVMGERRWRAAKLAELLEIPAVIREYTDKEAAEVTLVENLQREDTTPIEEANGIRLLLEQDSTIPEVANRLSKSTFWVQDRLNLLELPAKVREMLDAKIITLAHAKVICGLATAGDQIEAAERTHKYSLSVAQLRARTQHKQKETRDRVQTPSNERNLSRSILLLTAEFQSFRPDDTLPTGYRQALLIQMEMLSKALASAKERLTPKKQE